MQHGSDSSCFAYNQMNETYLDLCMEKKAYYELVVLGLLVKRMNGFLEFKFS